MASDEPSGGGSAAAATAAAGVPYKRASRRGAPKRFACNEPGCGKVYSRAEHLQRHQLNHNATVVHRCQVHDCNQAFVRRDLLERHMRRHSDSYVPRNRASSFTVRQRMASPNAANGSDVQMVNASASPTVGATGQGQVPPSFAQPPQSAPRNASVLLASDSAEPQRPLPPAPTWPSAPPVMEGMNMMRPKPAFYGREPTIVQKHSQSSFASFAGVPMPDADNNFAMWLFDPQGNYAGFNMANMPFFEGGLESPFNNNIHYDHESLTSRSQLDLSPPTHLDSPDELMSEYRRHDILKWVQIFRQKQPSYEPLIAGLVQESGGDLPGLSLEMMRDCVRHYWDHASARLPIVHQPTFSSNQCSVFLLMVIIALGAKSLHNQDTSVAFKEYGHFADLIITCVRWEIVTVEEASPPVGLWVAQALLLLEFYEKMFSTRKLHERAHIYHSATLTLLRRGSPLIGRSGSESPPDPTSRDTATADARTWWLRWADTEAMHRVVFAAFMMDSVHAAMFGHAADMAPHEIRLPLPCDDTLWSASTPESVRQQEANFRMYGLRPVSFLDGLKSAMHGKEVQTHSFGRLIIMCGLLSVGWHLSHQETHLKWLELTTPSHDTREKWCQMLLKAFDHWKTSFDQAMGTNDSDHDGQGNQSGSSGLVQSAAVLYHLAHISLFVDIIDCQVYAGAKRLLGRKISTRDHSNVVARMRLWANKASTRHAILHAYKLLHRVLVEQKHKRTPIFQNNNHPARIQYSCRHDPDPHRPWIMYYATLSIWSFVRALDYARSPASQAYPQQMRPAGGVAEYLSRVAKLQEIDTPTATMLHDGLPELLDAVGALTAEAHSELLVEAQHRLEQCKELLGSIETP